MSNTSASGGYLLPSASNSTPDGLTLTQFIQTMIVGISGITDTLVRPEWQVEPPKQPDLFTDWIAFGIVIPKADTYAAIFPTGDGTSSTLNRQEQIDIQMSFYGPNALDNFSIFRDGCQLQQNLEALQLVDMGYQDISQATRGPDLVNERWVERYVTTLTLVRQSVRTYPILLFASAAGTIHTVLENSNEDLNWDVEPPEDP